MIDWSVAAIRIGGAALIGGAIGLNRELHNKSAGVRTMGLVALVSAAVTLGSLEANDDKLPLQVIQGLLTGMGFLGAGVIMRGAHGHKVHGLTTAAAIWGSTGLGVLCGLGQWDLVIVSLVLCFVLLIGGGRFEKWVHCTFGDEKDKAKLGVDPGDG